MAYRPEDYNHSDVPNEANVFTLNSEYVYNDEVPRPESPNESSSKDIHFIKRLIKLVKRYPILFEKGHSRDRQILEARNKVWNKIAVKLNSNDLHCRTTWTKMRIALSRNLTRNRIKIHRGLVSPSTEPKWAFYKQLRFLLPYIGMYRSKNTYTSNSEDDELSDDSIALSKLRKKTSAISSLTNKKQVWETIEINDDDDDICLGNVKIADVRSEKNKDIPKMYNENRGSEIVKLNKYDKDYSIKNKIEDGSEDHDVVTSEYGGEAMQQDHNCNTVKNINFAFENQRTELGYVNVHKNINCDIVKTDTLSELKDDTMIELNMHQGHSFGTVKINDTYSDQDDATPMNLTNAIVQERNGDTVQKYDSTQEDRIGIMNELGDEVIKDDTGYEQHDDTSTELDDEHMHKDPSWGALKCEFDDFEQQNEAMTELGNDRNHNCCTKTLEEVTFDQETIEWDDEKPVRNWDSEKLDDSDEQQDKATIEVDNKHDSLVQQQNILHTETMQITADVGFIKPDVIQIVDADMSSIMDNNDRNNEKYQDVIPIDDANRSSVLVIDNRNNELKQDVLQLDDADKSSVMHNDDINNVKYQDVIQSDDAGRSNVMVIDDKNYEVSQDVIPIDNADRYIGIEDDDDRNNEQNQDVIQSDDTDSSTVLVIDDRNNKQKQDVLQLDDADKSSAMNNDDQNNVKYQDVIQSDDADRSNAMVIDDKNYEESQDVIPIDDADRYIGIDDDGDRNNEQNQDVIQSDDTDSSSVLVIDDTNYAQNQDVLQSDDANKSIDMENDDRYKEEKQDVIPFDDTGRSSVIKIKNRIFKRKPKNPFQVKRYADINDDIKFINLVESHPIVYTTYNKTLKIRTDKTIAWEKIGKEVNMSVINCKVIWQKIKNRFIHVLKTSKMKPFHLKHNDKLLVRHMKFLVPYLKVENLQSLHKDAEMTTDNTKVNNNVACTEPDKDVENTVNKPDKVTQKRIIGPIKEQVMKSYISLMLKKKSPSTEIEDDLGCYSSFFTK